MSGLGPHLAPPTKARGHLLDEMGRGRNLRLGQDDLATTQTAGRGHCPAAPVLNHYALLLGDAVNRHETRVVRGPQVLQTRIAEAHNQEGASTFG